MVDNHFALRFPRGDVIGVDTEAGEGFMFLPLDLIPQFVDHLRVVNANYETGSKDLKIVIDKNPYFARHG